MACITLKHKPALVAGKECITRAITYKDVECDLVDRLYYLRLDQ